MLNSITIKTRAKINLSLDVLFRRKDGYHEVEMIMQSIDLYDEMKFNLTKGEILIHCDNNQLPTDQTNIIYKVAQLLKETYHVEKGIEITLHKHIPIAAGLAGGSTNAAGTLKALNQLWELNLPLKTLMQLGGQIGADIPFCLLGGTVLATGIGEILQPLPSLPYTWLILVKPSFSISTYWAYQNIDVNKKIHHPNTKKIVESIVQENIEKAIPYFKNVLEEVTIKRYPEIKGIKDTMLNLGAIGALMSGSGPTVFGICKSKEQAQEIYKYFKKEYVDVFVVKTYNGIDKMDQGMKGE